MKIERGCSTPEEFLSNCGVTYPHSWATSGRASYNFIKVKFGRDINPFISKPVSEISEVVKHEAAGLVDQCKLIAREGIDARVLHFKRASA